MDSPRVRNALIQIAANPAGELRHAAMAVAVVLAANLLMRPRLMYALFSKICLLNLGLRHMLFSKDKKWPKQADSSVLDGQPVQEVTIVFIRHGESEWNDIFNKGLNPSFLLRLLVGFVRETLKLFSTDSVFIDSPLSAEGIAQAQSLAGYLAAPVGDSKMEAQLKGLIRRAPGSTPSIVVASNLRRAIATGALALNERLSRTREPVYVLSSLQEITTNIDALAITPVKKDPNIPGLGILYDVTSHKGNKSIKSNGAIRMREFAEWVFARRGKEAVIAVGHSLWFKSFFDVYLPKGVEATARKRKMSNCSVVSFTLQKGVVGGQVVFRIPPQSIMVLYGGFM